MLLVSQPPDSSARLIRRPVHEPLLAPPPLPNSPHPGLAPPCPADILLSWDYWELERKMSEGGGPISELPTIPKQFCSVDVRQKPLARRCRPAEATVCCAQHSTRVGLYTPQA